MRRERLFNHNKNSSSQYFVSPNFAASLFFLLLLLLSSRLFIWLLQFGRETFFNDVYTVMLPGCHHVTVRTKEAPITSWKPTEPSFVYCKRVWGGGWRGHKKNSPDHASVVCSIQQNIRRPLKIQVLAQWRNIKGNSEAWKEQMQLAMQSSQHQAEMFAAESELIR